MTVKTHFENMLIAELESLKSKGIHGVRNIDLLKFDIESPFGNTIQFLRNNQFELVYSIKDKETVFKTTYSGQIINDEFLNQLRIIDSAKGTIHTMINTILSLETAAN